MSDVRLVLNGREEAVSNVEPNTTLLRYLRDRRRLTGTKEGCAEGDCGACTVALLDVDHEGRPIWRAVNSCLVLLPSLHGREVVTVEGIAAPDGTLHPAQQAMVQRLGSQCGYCTPGFVMSLFEASYRTDLDDRGRRDDQICGNLCRCTGYRPIVQALDDVAGCQPDDAFRQALEGPAPELQGVSYAHGDLHFLRPSTLDALWAAMDTHPDHRLIAGTTDVGLEVTKRYASFPCMISLTALPELRDITTTEAGVQIGAAVRLTDLELACAEALPPVTRMLRYFASHQIKNRATVGGNLCNASPIGDLAPVLIALDAQAILLSPSGRRSLPLEDFFLTYRQTALGPQEILAAVFVPRIKDTTRATAFKVSKRREMDISAVAAGMAVTLDEHGSVTEARLAYGGMAATPARARRTEAALVGQPWSVHTAQAASDRIAQDFTPIDDQRGSAWYRAKVAANLLIGFALESEGGAPRPLPARSTGTVLLGGEP